MISVVHTGLQWSAVFVNQDTLWHMTLYCVNISKWDNCVGVILTFLYWIMIIMALFVLTYYFSTQVSSGYFNGAILASFV